MTYKAQHINVTINCPAARVYEFASNAANLPQWASGLAGAIKEDNGKWVAESPMGDVAIKFAPPNDFGILDHDVTLPSGETMYNPMRVFYNGRGCELVFTIYQRPGITDELFATDAKTVLQDLKRLKELMESDALPA